MVKRLLLPVPIRVCWFIFVCYVSLLMFVSLIINTNEIPNTAEAQNPIFSWFVETAIYIKQSTIKIRLVHVKLLLYLPCLYWWSSIFSEVLPLHGCMSVHIKYIMHVSQQLLIRPKKKKYCVFRVTQPTNHNIARPFLSSQENSTEKAQQCCDCRPNLQKTYVPFSDSVYFRLLFSYYFH